MGSDNDTDSRQKVVIVGSGPAGLTAALYTARANLTPLVLEGDEPGGQLTTTTDVENFPGFPDGIQGPEMMNLFRTQAEKFGAVCQREKVTRVELESRPYKVHYAGKVVEAESLIISTGASAKYLGLESEQLLRNKGVTACATCDGFFFKGMEVAVVGGGDTAMEEATFLTRFCPKVYVIHRRDKLRASKVMQDRALKNEKIQMVWDSTIEEVLDPAADKVTGLKLRNLKTDEVSELAVEGLFLAIGHRPNTAFLDGALKVNDTGYLVTDERTRTAKPGVFACGDCVDFRYRQAVTAAGTGCQSAMEAAWFLEEQDQEA